jgi:hypothetical protein
MRQSARGKKARYEYGRTSMQTVNTDPTMRISESNFPEAKGMWGQVPREEGSGDGGDRRDLSGGINWERED